MQIRSGAFREVDPKSIPSNDGRPNSGLREGGVSHAEVNAAIARVNKTIIFGQQNRLRHGILMDDEKLERFHAGHELVRFFYAGLNKLPDNLIDSFLDSNISITLITASSESDDDPTASAVDGSLIFYQDVRCHQSFHIGYTRRTIYLPEGMIREAINKGYDSWSIAETIIREAFPLLDYLLILEFVRHSIKRFKSHVTLGSHTTIKRDIGQLNKHLNRDPNDPDSPGIGEGDESEFGAFFRHYCGDLLKLKREILERDPYEVADEIYDEEQERTWAEVKVNQVATTFDYPSYFDLNRDIVHPAAYRAADILGQEVEPQTDSDFIHDLKDAARFRVLRQTRSNELLDGLLKMGGPGVLALARELGEERASGVLEIAEYQNDNYDVATVFKGKLEAMSSSGQEGIPGSICNDYRDLLQLKTKDGARAHLKRFAEVPAPEQLDSLPAFRKVVEKIVGFLNFKNPDDMAQAMATVYKSKKPGELIAFASHAVGKAEPEKERQLMLSILKKLNKHPEYHTVILAQAREMTESNSVSFGENVRGNVVGIFDLIPDRPYTKSSDPQGVSARFSRYEQMKKKDPDNEALIPLLAGILIRLDKTENFEEYLEAAASLGTRIRPELVFAVEKLNPNDPDKKLIVHGALGLLSRLGDLED